MFFVYFFPLEFQKILNYFVGKKGPIYALDWNPVKDEFVVVYGSNS